MESQIVDYYNSEPHNINIIEKLLKEINKLEEQLKYKNDSIHKYKIPHLLAYTLEDKIKHMKRKQQTIEKITTLIDKEYAIFLFDDSLNGLGISQDICINDYRKKMGEKLERYHYIQLHKKQKTVPKDDPMYHYDLFMKLINIIDEYTFYKNRDWCILFVESIFNTIHTRYHFLIEYMKMQFKTYQYDQYEEKGNKLSNMEVVDLFFRNKNKRIKNIYSCWSNRGTYLSLFNEIKNYLLKLLIGTNLKELNHPVQRGDDPNSHNSDKFNKSWKTIIPVHLQNIDNSLFFSIHDDVDIKDSRYWNCCIENTAYFYCPECKRCKNINEYDSRDSKRIFDKQVNNDHLKLICSWCFFNNRCKLQSIKNKTEQQQTLYEDYKKLDKLMKNRIDTDDDY